MKRFSIDEANKILPLIRPIVDDILASGKEMQRLMIEEELDKDNELVSQARLRLSKYIEELEELGCYFKDWNFQAGLVDFPAKIDGKEVFLCWRSDEDCVSHYHDLKSGFAGRKKIED